MHVEVQDEDGLINHEDGRPGDNEREHGERFIKSSCQILHHYPSSLINLFPDLSYYDHSLAPPWLHYADIPHHCHDYFRLCHD